MTEFDRMTIQNNYQRVKETIASVALSTGREPLSVKLVVVTKNHPSESAIAVIEAGARDLGENYAEEGAEKILACKMYSHVNWHMIGHIQSRKARLIAEYFDSVHSLDSSKLAQRLNRFAAEQCRQIPVLLECNMSGEESKHGFSAWDEKRWDNLLPDIEFILSLPNLNVQGLMTMAPYFSNPELSRPFYTKLRKLGDYLQKQLPQAPWLEYSMGMSADYSVAIQEGATQVRVGTAIMGERTYT